MGPDRRRKWKCSNECRNKRKRSSGSISDTDNTLEDEISDIRAAQMNMEAKQDALSGEIKALLLSFKEMMDTNKQLAEDNKVLKQENQSLKEEMAKMRTEVFSLRADFEGLNQYSRKQNLIIRGVPIQPNEDPKDSTNVAVMVISKLGINVSARDIEVSHRMAAPKDSPFPKPIIARFFDRKLTAHCTNRSREVKPSLLSLGLGGTNKDKVIISEQLTTYTRGLLSEVKKLIDQKEILHAWCREGAVYVRSRTGETGFRVKGFQDLWEYKWRRGNQNNGQQR